MISVVCVFNDKDSLEECLKESLKNNLKDDNYQLVLVDNTQNNYSSAAEALNHGGQKAQGKYIMFVHQDVYFDPNTSFSTLEDLLDSMANLGVAGVAGAPGDNEDIISNMKHGVPPRKVSPNRLIKPEKVQTVDECLFIVPKSVFDVLKFDEKLFRGWHLYAVDFSLSCQEKGLDVYVMPFSIYHRSIGYSLTGDFYQSAENVIKKHKTHYKKIYTTIGYWNTRQSFTYQKMKHKIHWNWTLLMDKFRIS